MAAAASIQNARHDEPLATVQLFQVRTGIFTQPQLATCRSPQGMASPVHPPPSRAGVPRVQYSIFVTLVLFGVAVLGTGLWIRSQTRPPHDPLFLTARHQIQGHQFQPVPLGSRVAETLATTNLFNGHFFDSRSNRVSVFEAQWQAGQGDGGNLFGHTPEICWAGQGFRTVRFGEPSQVFLSLAGRRIPFQCRVLRHPDLPTPEITLWAACLDGRWDDILFGSPPNLNDEAATVGTYLQEVGRTFTTRWASVRRLVQQPYTVGARKQFIRFSMPLHTGWEPALVELERFAQQWLDPRPPQ